MIIWLASFPRSGNTFFRILLKHVYGINTLSIYPENPHLPAVGHIETKVLLPELAASPEYYFIKTHEMPHEDYPAIYLVRDGRDVLVSYAKYVLDFDKNIPADTNPDLFLKTLHKVILEKHFGGWEGNVLAWTKRRTRTVIVKYEDLLKTPIETLRQTMQAINYCPPEVPQGPLPDFASLHEASPTFYRKGQAGTWRDAMPPDLHQLFWQKQGKAMRKMGYVRWA